MLSFIYTGSIDQAMLNNVAEKLFILADKYAILPLKSLAENHLISTITVDNIAFDVLLAGSYKGNRLNEVNQF